jgi:hypothetical protein
VNTCHLTRVICLLSLGCININNRSSGFAVLLSAPNVMRYVTGSTVKTNEDVQLDVKETPVLCEWVS